MIISPFFSLTAFIKFFSRSSNCPLYIAPATIADKSIAISCFPFIFSGTSSSIILLAKPSTTVVLPVPGSPINTGLFFFLLDNIWTILRISSSRPMTGSIFPSLESSVRFIPYFSSGFTPDSGFGFISCCMIYPI